MFLRAVLILFIFFLSQVPEILAHHLEFLEALEDRLKNWNMKQKIIIGDILLETVSILSRLLNNNDTFLVAFSHFMQKSVYV